MSKGWLVTQPYLEVGPILISCRVTILLNLKTFVHFVPACTGNAGEIWKKTNVVYNLEIIFAKICSIITENVFLRIRSDNIYISCFIII